MKSVNKNKIFNDPIYGFITIPNEKIFDLLEHPFFQRLRRISQLGFTYLVYPGAYHTRFHHALGAMHLTLLAIQVLRSKGHTITEEEEEAACIAILLHDIGHGPFSHALEHTLVKGINHEQLGLLFMEELNREFNGDLTMAIEVFKGNHPKKFLHQLVSSQLDMDRLDYLRRDSFYTGVTEGAINSERLITMLNLHNDELVIDAKGIYSVEKFIVARRFMYWQVYLHKTVISAEFMIVKTLQRARELALSGVELSASSSLKVFLNQHIAQEDFAKDPELLKTFARMDDYDIIGALKEWAHCDDVVLSELSQAILNRKLFKVKMQEATIPVAQRDELLKTIARDKGITIGEASYFLIEENIDNHAYNPSKDKIYLLYKDGSTQDIAQAADQLNISALSKRVTKHFVCYPEDYMQRP
ncbi:MAG: HD domain-containing protein [Schleiferiaceae bacterium]